MVTKKATKEAKAAPVLDVKAPSGAELATFTSIEGEDVANSLALIREIDIKTSVELEFAGNALKEVAQRHDAVDAKRKSWVEPLKKVAKSIDAAFKPVLDNLKEAEAILKQKIGAYHVGQEVARAALLQRAAIAAQQGNVIASAAIIQHAEAAIAATPTGVSAATYWTGEVLDGAVIPREYLMPDVAKLEAVTKATGADPKIPGWRAFPTAAVRTSRKGNV